MWDPGHQRKPSGTELRMLLPERPRGDERGSNGFYPTPAPNLSSAPHNLALTFGASLPPYQPHSHPTNPLQSCPWAFCPHTSLSHSGKATLTPSSPDSSSFSEHLQFQLANPQPSLCPNQGRGWVFPFPACSLFPQSDSMLESYSALSLSARNSM